MIDAQQWLIDLMASDIARVVGGVLVLTSVIELIDHLKGWMKKL